MKFRKKPVEVDAFRFGCDVVPEWFGNAVNSGSVDIHPCVLNKKESFAIIATLEGAHRANFGDYIIRGVKGELYPCKPDIFAMTYDSNIEEDEFIEDAERRKDTSMICPFCGGEVSILICDEEGNIHDSSYEEDPWSGIAYAIRHDIVQMNGNCPIATDVGEMIGGYIYKSRENAIKSWNMRNGT